MYKIEITAETLAELAGKAASLAAKLNTGAGTERAMSWSPIKEAADIELEVAEAAPADPTPAQTGEAARPAEPATEPAASEPTTSAPSAEASASELDFDADVAPYVLQVVKEKGKPVAQEILSQFGVEKASSLDPAQWPELVATLKAAL